MHILGSRSLSKSAEKALSKAVHTFLENHQNQIEKQEKKKKRKHKHTQIANLQKEKEK